MTTSIVPGVLDNSAAHSPEQLDKLASNSKDKEKQAKIISWTKDAHQRCKTQRQQIERQWYVNLAFYIGRQNVAQVPITGSSASAGVRLYIPPVPYYRSRPVFNRIRPIVRKELAKLTSQKPSANVIPATSDEQDQAAAKAGEQIWDSVFRRKKIHGIHSQAQMWARTCGVGFVKSYWDPNAPDPDSNIPGDFVYDVVTPFHLFVPDMLAVDIEDQPYIIQITTRTAAWVRLNCPGVNPAPNVMEASDILSDSFLNLVGAGDFRKDAVLCYEVWVKPGNVEFLPNGGMFSIVGDTVTQLVENGNPYIHQQYPFCKLDNIPTSRFYCDSVINDLIPVQREYNRTRGQIIENKNRMSHLQLLAAEGSVDAAKITTEPGQVIYYKLGYPAPTPMPVQGIPAYVIQEVQSQLLDFDDISGQHDVSKGQTPPGVTAATAINFLQEQDETMLAASFQSIEAFYEKLAYQTLCYVKQYWDAPRMVKVSGQDKQFDVIAFQGSDLRSNTDIRIEAGSALPTSKSAKQALLMDLMSQQFIAPEQGLELMEMGGTAELYEQLQVDVSQATRENMKMANVTPDIMNQYLQTFQGQDPMSGQAQLIDPNRGGAPLQDITGMPTEPPLIVPVNSFDNHAAHINTHNNYRKSQKYENLAPEIKQLFEEHVNQHMQAMGMPPGMPDPTTNQTIPMDQSQQDPNAPSSGPESTPPGAPPVSSPQQGQGSSGMPPAGANIPNMM